MKFWTRNRPGDQMRDKYNLNTLPPSLAGLEDYEMDEHVMIPGMGGMNDDRNEFGEPMMNEPPPSLGGNQIHSQIEPANDIGIIPGLDLDISSLRDKKIPFNKPIPKNFQAQWNVENKYDEVYGTTAHDSASILECVRDVIGKVIQRMPGIMPLDDLKPEKIQIYGKEIDVVRKCHQKHEIALNFKLLFFTAGSKLHQAILEGFESLNKYIHSGDLEELADVVPYEDFADYTAEDFIQDHATATIGDEEYQLPDQNQDEEEDDFDDFEPRSKRFRNDYDQYENEGSNQGSNDYDSRYNQPGIPSLLNLNVAPPRHGQKEENVSAKSPTVVSPWETSNQNNISGGNKDRRDNRRGSRWSSRR